MNSEDITTKPTIETVLERIDDFRKSVEANFDNLGNRVSNLENKVGGLEGKVDKLENKVDGLEQRFDKRFDSLEKRMDSLEKITNVMRDDMLALRMEIRDVRKTVEQNVSL